MLGNMWLVYLQWRRSRTSQNKRNTRFIAVMTNGDWQRSHPLHTDTCLFHKKNRTDSKRKKKQQELKKRKKQDQTENESDGSFYEEGKCIVCTEFELQKTSYIVFCPELKKKKRVSGSNKKKQTQKASGNTYKQLKKNRWVTYCR
jgi:hypothetical protein